MAGTEPQAWGTGLMADFTHVGLEVPKPARAKGGEGVGGGRREWAQG